MTAPAAHTNIFSDDLKTAIKARRTGQCIIPIRVEGSRIPLFMLAGVRDLRTLAVHLGESQPLYGFIPLGYGNTERIAARYIRELRRIQPKGPYCLAGFCMFGLIAFEMAQQLKQRGEEVALLAIIETYIHNHSAKAKGLRSYGRKLKSFFQKLHWMNARERKTYLSKLLRKYAGFMFPGSKNNNHQYIIKPYTGKMILFGGHHSKVKIFYQDELLMGWNAYAKGEVHLCEIQSDHLGIFEEPGVIELAEKMNHALIQL